MPLDPDSSYPSDYSDLGKPFRPRCSPVPSALPHFLHKISAGFPSPASDYVEEGLDLNSYIVKNKSATFFFTVEGESMRHAGIFPGDVLAVDRSQTAVSGAIVVAVINNEFTVKRLYRKGDIVELRPENPAYAPIRITEEHDCIIWGEVIGVIRKTRK